MRFSLAIISAAILANMVSAAPAAAQSDMGIGAKEFEGKQVSDLSMKEDFEPFHWKTEEGDNHVDRGFTVELSEPAEFQITNFMMGGDVYEVLDNGKSIGKTSELELTDDEPLYAATPEEALKDPRFSKATYPLEAGSHEITIKVADSMNENGTGAVRVVQKMQSLYGKKKNDDDDEDDDDKDDEDWDDNDEDNDKKRGKKGGKKTVYVYYTVTVPTLPTVTLTTATGTETVIVTQTVVAETTATVEATRLLQLPFLTVA